MILFTLHGFGQDTLNKPVLIASDSMFMEAVSGVPSLPPLEEVVQMVFSNAPALKRQDHFIERDYQNYKAKKKQWANRIFTDAGYSYANNINSTTVQNPDGTFEALSLQDGDVLRAGVSVRLNLFDLIGQPHLRKQALEEYEAAREEKNLLKQDIRIEVTRLYQDAVLKRKNVGIQQEYFESITMLKEMTERSYKEGEEKLSEMARVHELFTRAKVQLEQSIAQYKTAYMTLETLCGTNFNAY